MGTPNYEIRPHHAFKGWYIIFKNGISLGARASKTEAEEYITRHKTIQSMKERQIKL
jgi:hypothetical protein